MTAIKAILLVQSSKHLSALLGFQRLRQLVGKSFSYELFNLTVVQVNAWSFHVNCIKHIIFSRFLILVQFDMSFSPVAEKLSCEVDALLWCSS